MGTLSGLQAVAGTAARCYPQSNVSCEGQGLEVNSYFRPNMNFVSVGKLRSQQWLPWWLRCLAVLAFACMDMHVDAQVKGVEALIGPIETSFRSMNLSGQMVRSGEDALIVGWRSARRGVPYNNIYLQKVNHEGIAFWEADGTPLCPYPANQDAFCMVEDGFGGLVVVWEDYRHGLDAPAIYAQRINLRGEPLWGMEGLRICDSPAGQRKPRIISDLENGFYVVWEDFRQGNEAADLYGQLLDLSGRLRWRLTGNPITTAQGIQQNFTLATDEKHFLYLVWEDFRNGVYWNLHAQKLDQAGNFFWTAGGMDIFAGVEENQNRPSIVPDGYGGLLFVYQKYSAETEGTDIYRGRINSGGDVIFHFATCYAENEQRNPIIMKKGSKAVLCWEDRRSGNWDIYAQMIRLHDGILEWDVNGVAVANTAMEEVAPVVITGASYGYQLFSWTRQSAESKQIFVQKINNLGEGAWAAGGVSVCPYSNEQLAPAILADEMGGLWCLWTDQQEVAAHVFLQHINGNCLPLLQRNGIRLGVTHQGVYARIGGLEVLAAKTGEYYLVWEDGRNGARNSDIYLQKLDANGRPVWRRNGIPVCLAPDDQSSPILVEDGVGGVIVTWYDRRKGKDENIYAQRVSAGGILLWPSDGVVVCDAPGDQNSIHAISDGHEGMVLSWVDARSLTETGFDLYLQRIGHDGDALWGPNGKPFSNFPGLQTGPRMLADGTGGAFMVWMDARNGVSNIFLQRINSFGIYEWEYGGRAASPSIHAQRYPFAVVNEQNELNIGWQESHQGDSYDKLYLQSYTSNGGRLWESGGKPVCSHGGRQTAVQISSGAASDFWVTWLDDREKNFSGLQLMIQKYDLSGRALWNPDGIPLGERLEEWNEYVCISNYTGHITAAWTSRVTANSKHLYLQRVDPEASKTLGEKGFALGKPNTHQFSPKLVSGKGKETHTFWIEESLLERQFVINSYLIR
jgi:hypothetical protein